MISIANKNITSNDFSSQYPSDGIEMNIIGRMSESSLTYHYANMDILKFELSLRRSIVDASKELHKSKLAFSTFRKSKCNMKYWTRTDEGGFLLNADTSPLTAIRDIFSQGYEYATECATAIIILYYGAISESFSEALFNNTFRDIYLMNWKRLDRNMNVKTYYNVMDQLPGDCRYFRNPDVDPLTPEWQGENAIDLGDGTYYGHGIGIKNADGIIDSLNKHRKSEAAISAYMLDTAVRPGFKHLADMNHSIHSYPMPHSEGISRYYGFALQQPIITFC